MRCHTERVIKREDKEGEREGKKDKEREREREEASKDANIITRATRIGPRCSFYLSCALPL